MTDCSSCTAHVEPGDAFRQQCGTPAISSVTSGDTVAAGAQAPSGTVPGPTGTLEPVTPLPSAVLPNAWRATPVASTPTRPPTQPPSASIPSIPAPRRGSFSNTPIYKRWWLWVGVAALAVYGLVHVIQEHIPSNTAQLCSAYSDLSQKINQDSGVFDNPVFSAVGNLSGIAARYPDSQAVKDEASQLKSIAAGNSTSVGEISNASTSIAGVCGQSPLGFSLGSS